MLLVDRIFVCKISRFREVQNFCLRERGVVAITRVLIRQSVNQKLYDLRLACGNGTMRQF